MRWLYYILGGGFKHLYVYLYSRKRCSLTHIFQMGSIDLLLLKYGRKAENVWILPSMWHEVNLNMGELASLPGWMVLRSSDATRSEEGRRIRRQSAEISEPWEPL